MSGRHARPGRIDRVKLAAWAGIGAFCVVVWGVIIGGIIVLARLPW